MKILVIGSGGREHAICWKLAQSEQTAKLFCAPGNPGTATVAENVDIKADDLDGLVAFAQKENIDLTVVGPDQPLADGIVDKFQGRGLRIFGPTAGAARLESSKSFAKELMIEANIPTAHYKVISSVEEARALPAEFDNSAVKADWLALGKGVILCHSRAELLDAVGKLIESSPPGNRSMKIVIEEFLDGEEATVLAFCDGDTASLMVPSQDHKKAFDGDKGPNTGGMGAYAPTPFALGLERQIQAQVFTPVLREMARRGTPFTGVLYAGLMIKNGKFKVLEFNARFGDPETQPILYLLESDLVDIANACIEGRLANIEIKWSRDAACCVVVASGGYPGKYETGKAVTGVEAANKINGVTVFHAGTKISDGGLVTSGGRVFGVTARGKTVKEAIDTAYSGVSHINFEGMHYRKDIGKAALGVK